MDYASLLEHITNIYHTPLIIGTQALKVKVIHFDMIYYAFTLSCNAGQIILQEIESDDNNMTFDECIIGLLDYINVQEYPYSYAHSMSIIYDIEPGPFNFIKLQQLTPDASSYFIGPNDQLGYYWCNEISDPTNQYNEISDATNQYISNWGIYDARKSVPESIGYINRLLILIIKYYDSRSIMRLGG